MGDETTCIILSFAWTPIAAIALTALVILYAKFRIESDVIRKDKVQRLIQYPVILLILTLISIPFWIYLIPQTILPECGGPAQIIPVAKNKIINTFSDNTTTKEFVFPIDGGFNSDASVILPKNVKILKSNIEVEHQPEEFWVDEFYNLSKTIDPAGLEIDEAGNFVRIKTSKLDVVEDTELFGTKIYDDVYVHKGSQIIVPPGRKLNLIVKGTVKIENGGGIDADGRPLYNTEDVRDEPIHGADGSGGGGGGYGGNGGKGGDDISKKGGDGGKAFGKEEEPSAVGNDGARGGGSLADPGTGYPGAGGKSGGAIKIEANKIIVEGSITANGENGMYSSGTEGTGGGGGGSGGGIIIVTNDFTFTGKIGADGGKGGDDKQPYSDSKDSDGAGGGGGGGRVAIIYNKKDDFGVITVKKGEGGKSKDASKNGQSGEQGTIKWINKELAGLSLVRINLTSIPIKPNNLDFWKTFQANASVPKGTEMRFRILDGKEDKVLCDIGAEEASNGSSIGDCAGDASSIRLNAEFVTINFLRSPELYNWNVSYDTVIKNLDFDLGVDQIVEYSSPYFSGKTKITDNTTSPPLSENINQLVRDCSCRGCTPSLGYCTITIRVLSKSSGILKLGNLSLEYVSSE